jgi:hypothetical protein
MYPLYFLVKHLRTYSPQEIAPWGNLVPFLGEATTPFLLKIERDLES